MKSHALWFLMIIILTRTAAGQVAPAADYHQHVFSPVIAKLLNPSASGPQQLTAGDVVALLDTAGIRRGLLLSVAYMYCSPTRTVEDEYAKVRAENDWPLAATSSA